MEAVTALLAAISTLAWPLIALAALLRYSTQISRLLDKFSQGKLTIKVGNTELTMEEVSKQQWQIVEDIQAKVAELEQRIGQTPRAAPAAAPTRTDWRILWVDDLPQNNRMLAGLLEAKGARIDLALSSVEALEKFKGGHYDVVISDMGRPEGKEAGIELARELRAIDVHLLQPLVGRASARAGVAGGGQWDYCFWHYAARAFDGFEGAVNQWTGAKFNCLCRSDFSPTRC